MEGCVRVQLISPPRHRPLHSATSTPASLRCRHRLPHSLTTVLNQRRRRRGRSFSPWEGVCGLKEADSPASLLPRFGPGLAPPSPSDGNSNYVDSTICGKAGRKLLSILKSQPQKKQKTRFPPCGAKETDLRRRHRLGRSAGMKWDQLIEQRSSLFWHGRVSASPKHCTAMRTPLCPSRRPQPPASAAAMDPSLTPRRRSVTSTAPNPWLT